MKKLICILLTTLILAGAFGGCGSREGEAVSLFIKDDEIYTYEKIDPEKTQLVVSRLGNNANVELIASAFMEKNPDVQVICIDITGGNDAYRPVLDWVERGLAPDVMYVNLASFIEADFVKQYFTNLSANPAASMFEADALNEVAVDSEIYFLPGPSEINCMIYNKTLFERYGWELPTSFAEFVALCLQITADTNGEIEPWNPNAKYDSQLTIAAEAFTYVELLGGLENRLWYDEFCEGKAAFAGHMEPFFAMLQTLIDNGLLTEEHFTYSATTRAKEFDEGQIAMINGVLSTYAADGEYEFGFMPYPTTIGDTGYVNNYFNALFCVPLKQRSDKQQDALERFIAFYASAEGQQAIIGDSLMVSNLKDAPHEQNPALAELMATIAAGNQFSFFDFCAASARSWTVQEYALAMAKGEKTGPECIAAIDAQPFLPPDQAAVDPGEKLADIAQDFTSLEFSSYIADMYRETAAADIGLINHGIAHRGNLARLFTGQLNNNMVTVLKPRSFANDSTLLKVSMSGSQILKALNNPLGNDAVTNSIYAFSGLQCEVAPWNEVGSKYLSVKLADGTALEPDKLYTVAIWAGTVADEYITATLETYPGTWEELMTAKFKADATLTPADDDRIKLIWN